MRFDDRIATILALPDDSAEARAAKWHQLADVVAQCGDEAQDCAADALNYLNAHRGAVPAAAGQREPQMLPPGSPEIATGQPEGDSGRISHIRGLVARLASLSSASPALHIPKVSQFRFETQADGTIHWVEGAPRAALVGQSVASPAAFRFGVGQEAVRAFRLRAPFRDAPFRVAGEGPASGDWMLSGVPFFDARTGQFRGYRGSAVRVEAAAEAPLPSPLPGGDIPPESLRQLIHELRTPLNAISGFAELIDGEYLGPADARHRARASAIRGEAARLLGAVDDLDAAARISGPLPAAARGPTDAAALLTEEAQSHVEAAARRGATLRILIGKNLPSMAVDHDNAARMMTRLLDVAAGLAGKGEVLVASLGQEDEDGKTMLCFAIDRPRALSGTAEADVWQPGFAAPHAAPDAPALGLSFTLRLVRSLAGMAGGRLTLDADRLSLTIPAA